MLFIPQTAECLAVFFEITRHWFWEWFFMSRLPRRWSWNNHMWWNILVIPTSHVVLEEYWNANKNLIKKEVRVCLEGKIINIVPFISESKWIISILIGQIRSFLTFHELYTHGIWRLFHLPPSEILNYLFLNEIF